jgi:hypothetical protein
VSAVQLVDVDDLDDGLTAAPADQVLAVPPGIKRSRRPAPRVRPRKRPTPAAENFYPHVFAFVQDFWSVTFAHAVGDRITHWRWCPQWWAHAEALARLESCWKAWEVLRLDPGTGASVWFRDHADPCLAALTSPDGPFAKCSDAEHKPPAPLPLVPPPVGLF